MGPFLLHLSNDSATETQMYKSNESIVRRVEVKAECFRKNNKTETMQLMVMPVHFQYLSIKQMNPACAKQFPNHHKLVIGQ